MDAQTRRVLRPYILLTTGVVAVFLLGWFLIDALLPGGLRQAMLLTLPADTGSLLTDYALTIFQAVVLGVGTFLAVRLSRRGPG